MHKIKKKWEFLVTLAIVLPLLAAILIYNVTHDPWMTFGSAIVAELPVLIAFISLKYFKKENKKELAKYLEAVEYTKKQLEHDKLVKEAARKNSYKDKDYDEIDAYAYDRRIERKGVEFFIQANYKVSFLDTLNYFIDKHNQVDVSLYHVIDKETLKALRNPNQEISLSDVYYIALALRLSTFETDQLLSSAGYSYDSGSKLDVCMLYFIKNGLYDINMINIALSNLEVNILTGIAK